MENILKQITVLTNMLANIFDSTNKTLCSNCPDKTWWHRLWKKDNKGEIINYDIQRQETVVWDFKGCCATCAKQNGHFQDFGRCDIITNSPYSKQLNFLKQTYNFTPDRGFFDNILKTCSLPRHLRSRTCLRFTCSHMQQLLGKDKVDLIEGIVGHISGIRFDNNLIN